MTLMNCSLTLIVNYLHAVKLKVIASATWLVTTASYKWRGDIVFPNIAFDVTKRSLHFTWGVAEAKCIVVTGVCVCVSVCLSLPAFPHHCTDPDVTWGMVGVPHSCALLSGFAIGARVSLLWQYSAEREMWASACIRSMPGLLCDLCAEKSRCYWMWFS